MMENNSLSPSPASSSSSGRYQPIALGYIRTPDFNYKLAPVLHRGQRSLQEESLHIGNNAGNHIAHMFYCLVIIQ